LKEALASLNPAQRETVLYLGHCLAIATAGSGKTKTLAVKAAKLLLEGQHVAAVTFTREAALELRERIVSLAGDQCQPRLLVGTFHSVCMLMAFPSRSKGIFGRSILSAMKSKLTEPWVLVKEGVRRGYLIRAMEDSGVKLAIDEATALIEKYKESRSTIGLEDSTIEMMNNYLRLMDSAKVIDFSDIIIKTVEGLKDKTISPLAVDHLLIDEYQDTDKIQYEWSKLHGISGISLTAVGDDDQSIYGFRRALGYDGMQMFTTQFNAHRILLGANYRCRAEILGAADQLIRRNTERIEKQLIAHKGAGGIVTWEIFDSKTNEANAVAEEAYAAMVDNASFAVLSRTKSDLFDVERALIERGVPFRKADGESIFNRQEVQVYAALLRSLIKPIPNDVDQVLAWCGMGMTDAAEIRKLFGPIIRMGSKADFANSKITDAGIETWRAFAKKYSEWQALIEKKLFSLLNAGTFMWLSEHLKKPHSIDVLSVARDMYEVQKDTLVEKLKIMGDIERNLTKKETTGYAASLMTAHSSKGLEFDRVWIVGLRNGVFPSDKSGLEEERRLMFVAITRAREMLFASVTNDCKPSIFIAESGITKAS
jgi:DNA helicase-2/ATP-dependent DNA helicase PcrA